MPLCAHQFRWHHQLARRLLLGRRQNCQHLKSAKNHRSKSKAAAAQSQVHAASSSSSSSNSSRLEGRPLDACLGPGLQLMEQEFSVAGHILRMIAPMDVDAVMDMYIAAGIDGDPYWCRVWPAAICLAQELLQRPELVAGKKVADLGAGLGVGGIAAALAGAREVVLLDREPLALQCALMSAAASGLQSVVGLQEVETAGAARYAAAAAASQAMPAAAAASADALQVAQLYLHQRIQQQQRQQQQEEEEEARATGLPLAASSSDVDGSCSQLLLRSHQQLQQAASRSSSSAVVRACMFDWSSTTAPERYDVVLACDVLYEDTAVDPVAAVVGRLLKPGPGSSLLLADPPNRTAANRQRFVELLSGSRPSALLLEESGVYQCDVKQLDPEMLGGVASQSVAVQFMAFRSAVGNDTVGLKLN